MAYEGVYTDPETGQDTMLKGSKWDGGHGNNSKQNLRLYRRDEF